MATYINNGTGNWSSNTSWYTCDSTAELDSLGGTNAWDVNTRDSATFTPGAITVDGIALRLSGTANSGATYTVTLRNSTDATNVTSVTVNGSDLTNIATVAGAEEWVFFKFSASQTLTAGKAYLVRTVGASTPGTSLLIANNGTTSNHSRQLRTTTSPGAAPAAGDKIIICGEMTGAGTSNARTVTLDNDQSGTSIGNTTFNQSVHVGFKGTLTFADTSKLKWKGVFGVYGGATLNVGTNGSSITAEMLMDVATNVDTGLVFNNGSTVNIYGNSKSVVNTLMTADKVATNTVIAVASTSGWANSDVLAFASTTRTTSDCESKTISTVDSGTQVTLTAGLSAAHSGTSPTQAEVINLTRSVKIHGASTSLCGYVTVSATAVVNIQYAEFYNLGSVSSNFRGIQSQTTTGTFIFKYNSCHDYFSSTNSHGVHFNGASGQTASTLVISTNVFYSITQGTGIGNSVTSGTWTADGNITFLGGTCYSLSDVGGTFTNNVAVGGTTGISANEAGSFVSFSGNTAHSNSGTGFSLGAFVASICNTITSWRNGSFGADVGGGGSNGLRSCSFDSMTMFGNTTSNMRLFGAVDCLFTNGVFSGDSTFSTATGVSNGLSCANNTFESCTFGVASGIKVAHSSQDFQMAIYNTVFLRNCNLASTTEVASWASSPTILHAFIVSQKHDQTTGNHKFWLQYGIGTTDTTIYNTASPSLRLTPNNASNKMESALPTTVGTYKVHVDNGVAPTVTVYVRKSASGDGAAYTGNQPRLIIRKNVALGINSDTVLATMSAGTGSWQQLSGTPSAPTDDGVMEFIVDCDGTAGWVNVDDWSHTPMKDGRGGKYYLEGLPFLAGGGSGVSRGRVVLA